MVTGVARLPNLAEQLPGTLLSLTQGTSVCDVARIGEKAVAIGVNDKPSGEQARDDLGASATAQAIHRTFSEIAVAAL